MEHMVLVAADVDGLMSKVLLVLHLLVEVQ
jgi:hypothetical protein